MLDLAAIESAAARLAPVLHRTPAARSAELSGLLGRTVIVKPEHFQRTGSFKLRGAFNCVSTLASDGVHEVVAASAGNHAQGVALASALSGIRATIFMPTTVSLPKLEATRSYGAEIELVGASVSDSMDAARAYAAAHAARYVPPFDDELVVAGQGTIGYELVDEAPEAEHVVVPVGGGGLVGGIAVALRARGSGAHIVGVQASGAASMLAALERGEPVALDTVDTLADGIAIRSVSRLTLDLVSSYVDEVIAVDDEEISRAMLTMLERCKWVVEPAGAVGVAALLASRIPGDGPVVVVVSGGNVDPLLLTHLIEHALSLEGRYVTARVMLPDRPGSLANLTELLGRLGLNLLTVEHRRVGSPVRVNEVEVVVTMETRDPRHLEQVAAALAAAGFHAEIER